MPNNNDFLNKYITTKIRRNQKKIQMKNLNKKKKNNEERKSFSFTFVSGLIPHLSSAYKM